MTVCDADPRWDAMHPGGILMFRSCAQGYLHSVVLGEAAHDVDAATLAGAILAAAQASHRKAAQQCQRSANSALMRSSSAP